MLVTKQEARDILYKENQEWEEVKDTREILGQSRWTISKSAIFHHIPSDKFYTLEWDEGATEYQDWTEPFECYPDDAVELIEVEYKEVTTMEWVPVS